MVRMLTDKVSPDVICESSFEYELPADYGDLLNGLPEVDSVYHDGVLNAISRHIEKKFAKSGFFPRELISP